MNGEGQLVAVACNQSCSSVGREPLRQWAQGDDDDHDACDDEFSSCGQLDPSTEKEGERVREREEEGISQRTEGGKWTLKNKSSKLGPREDFGGSVPLDKSIWNTTPSHKSRDINRANADVS